MVKLDDELARLAALQRYEILDTEPENEFDLLTELLRSIFSMPMATMTLIDRDRQWFKSHPGIQAAETPREMAFCNHTIRQDGVLAIPDTLEDERFRDNPLVIASPGIRSYIGAPLTTPDGYNIGSLCVIGDAPRAFSETDRNVIANLAKVIMSQLELRLIASEDQLTGAASRRAFLNVLTRELDRCKRTYNQGSLLIFDLDNFKSINDRHGHATGDSVLKMTAQTVFRSIRQGDVLGRIGGEEFGIFLSGAGASEGMEAAERIRQALERARLPDVPDLHFTASFGVMPCLPVFENANAWLSAGDKLLYEAKNGGRNRTVASVGRFNAVAQVRGDRRLH